MHTDDHTQEAWLQAFYQNLQSLADSAFPKQCPMCGKTYPDSHSFLTETTPVKNGHLQDKPGLFPMPEMGKNMAAIGVFRNCVCGTTLMADFHDRRDVSGSGIERRGHFQALLQSLCEQGVDQNEARTELCNLLHGEDSPKIWQWLLRAKATRPASQNET